MSFENLMNAFAARQQLGQLESKNNQFFLTIDNRIEVSCFQANGRFYVYGIVASLPEDELKREELLTTLLEKNLVLLATEPVSLCIDSEQDSLAIYISVPLKDLNLGGIEESISTLANNYELFLQWTGQSAPPPPPPSMMLMP
ncbi:CesT family type III secretion system chaperone [Endozoicomonas sp.]|uniref:CesT family type III secretion system chaperone n=1 Tax=Endozoicomonas sp. TaxID=1892382 RepID=UPI0028877A27|nr:CesT family type III secretion system chaperone [Endozoicomonas sp.]